MHADDLGYDQNRRATLLWCAVLSVAVVLTAVLAAGVGPIAIAPGTVARIAGHHVAGLPNVADWPASHDAIIWQVRAPRVLLGVIAGAALAVAGAVLQTVIRNVLADPHILGVTAGASTGAAGYALFATATSGALLTVSAFAGALVATALLFAVAGIRGHATAIRMLLAGVTIGYIFSAMTSFLVFASDTPEGARAVLFWLLGSLGPATWTAVLTTGPVIGAALLAIYALAPRLDALAAGDDTARTLGFTPARLRIVALLLVSLVVATVISVVGAIGFVGLIVPHVARLICGAGHRRLLPVSALLGAIFLVLADTFARTAFAPSEMPLGIVTAVVGAPLLLILVRRYRA